MVTSKNKDAFNILVFIAAVIFLFFLHEDLENSKKITIRRQVVECISFIDRNSNLNTSLIRRKCIQFVDEKHEKWKDIAIEYLN